MRFTGGYWADSPVTCTPQPRARRPAKRHLPMPDKSRKQRLREFLAAGPIAAIGEAEWQAALRTLAPISESYLRDLLRETGLAFAQPYAGIRQKSFADLERDLREILAIYSEAMRAGDRQRARYCRRQAIAAKDRARLVARSPKTSPEKKAQKDEMAQWMLVWLENPEVFPAWVEIRKR